MDEFLDKSYMLVDSKNLEDYFIFIGLGYFARKVALTLKQTVRLSLNEDGSYKFEFTSPLASSTIEFISGVEFEEIRPDSEKLKSMITIDGNVMTHTQTDNVGRTCIHVREFQVDKMTTTTTAEGMDKIIFRNYVAQ